MSDPQAPPSLVFTLIGTARALEAKLEGPLQELGLSLAKFGVLDHLVRAGSPLSLSELAAKSNCVKSNMTQLVDRLEADSLVRRTADSDDRRVTRAALTPMGSERHQRAVGVITRVQEACLTRLTAADQASLGWALRRLS